ncbi:DUF5977 domain-containing protein [Flavobacterium sp. N502540]|uniref:DUF5977 domain-containing protein n=1 Tax=Flavobacterium sp. N502540 TaxID=2986838 RepID=UPI0022246331|nr:DUF5977 domain-containing protein [Flavobacterium sp. N502540]
MKKSFIPFLIFVLLCISKTAAQNDAIMQPQITPPYPGTADLGNYGNVPVGLFTGSPAVNLELYTLKEGGNTIPLSMSYNSNGVQVDAIPRQLGIDWNLIATGVITRSVMDQPDEEISFYDANASLIDCSPNDTAKNIGGSNQVDTEKDVFNLNAFGLSVKFILADDRRNTIQIEQSKIKIVYEGGFFTVVDVDGTVYTFGGMNAVEESLSRNEGVSGPVPPVHYNTAWYLTKIQKTGGVSPVIFSYSQEWMRFYSSYFQKSVSTQQNIRSTGYMSSISQPRTQTYKNKQYHKTSLLKEIKINNKKIIFDYDYKNPPAEFQSHNSKQLISIKVYNDTINLANSLIKKIDFNYDQITPSNIGANGYTDIDQKLIFLKEVREQGKSSSAEFVKYSFDYYQPEKLPARHSFAKDLYGYFNGGNGVNDLIFNNISTSTAPGNECNFSPLFSAYKSIGSLRAPNDLYTYFGMLKSIYYPTKGKTVLEYESNKLVANVFMKGKNTSTVTVDCQNSTTGVSIPFQIGKRQIVAISGNVGMDDEEGLCENYFAAPHHVTGQKVFVKILDASTDAILYSFDNTQERVINKEVCLEAGWYKITVKASKCSFGNASIKFFPTGMEPHWENKETPMAGVRVMRTTDYDNNGTANTKRYYYGTLDNLATSSGAFTTIDPYITENIDVSDVDLIDLGQYTGDVSTRDFVRTFTVTSSPKSSLTSFDGTAIGYRSVVESWGGDHFENGGIENIFDVNSDIEPIMLCQEIIRNVNYSNSHLNGKPVKKKIFKKENGLVKNISVEQYFYDVKPELEYSKNNFVGIPYYSAKNFVLYVINQYSITSRFSYLSKKIVSSFDIMGQNPVSVTTLYDYTNNAHLQLTSESILNLNEEKELETKYYYPDDLLNEPFMVELKVANRISLPIIAERYKDGTLLSKNKTVYTKDPTTGNLLLPKEIYSSKFPNDLQNLANIGNLEKKITYNQYDEKGNVLQYTVESGTPVSIIWGYNKTQPIAKIENVIYNSISAGIISNLQSRSNEDDDNCMSENCTEQLLRNELNTLRNTFQNAFITTYTYNPLVGVTSVTDSKGIPSYYEYDSFGRLKFIKDQDLNILQKYCYNYKGQQADCSDNTSTAEYLYKSAARSGVFTKNNCAAGGTGSSVPYSQAAGAYISTISQADAESHGLDKFNTDGRAYANADGYCTFYSAAISRSIAKNDCAVGGEGSSVPYSQIYGAERSFSSQAEADSKGLAKFNTEGQAYANANGKCFFYSIAYSDIFTNDECGLTGTGTSHYYTLAARAEKSEVSQGEANHKAALRFLAEGQIYANTAGSCVFNSAPLGGYFLKNSCPAGTVSTSGPIYFEQSRGAVTSKISQANADELAAVKFNTDGPNHANTVGECFYYSAPISGSFTKTNCPPGGIGSTDVYSLGYGAGKSKVSQAEADAEALEQLNYYGKVQAEYGGTCTYLSQRVVYKIYKDDYCPPGTTFPYVYYIVEQGKYHSEISQVDADNKAWVDVSANAQAYANANGICLRHGEVEE